MQKPLLLPLLILTILSGCIPGPRDFSSGTWQYADLRLLDPVEESDPHLDLIAAYARCTTDGLDIRLDLLESIDPWSYDLYLAIDDRPGGVREMPIGEEADLRWDLWIALRAGQPAKARFSRADQQQVITPRAWRNTRLDYVQARIPAETPCKSNTRIQAFLTEPGENQVADFTEPFALSGKPPQRVPLLLAFWDTLPAITPSQALRRWSGAHTGPYGQRHGLAILLEAVDHTKVPVTLLDLNQPASLSALEAVGGTAWVRKLAGQGRIALPQVRSNQPAKDDLFELSRQAVAAFHLPQSPLTFDPALFHVNGQLLQVFHDSASGQAASNQSLTSITGVDGSFRQANEGGLTLDAKKALLETAQSPDGYGFVTLGGSLPQSEWADSEIAIPALEYIITHPWIRSLSGSDLTALLTTPRKESTDQTTPSWLCEEANQIRGFDSFGNPLPQTATQVRQLLEDQLAALPETPFTDQAWHALAALAAPSTGCEITKLQANYLGEIGYLLAAARWSLEPADQTDCSQDVDFDGLTECILSNPYALAIIEPDNARLAFAALRTEAATFQIIGMQSQFGVGLSDPLVWRLQRGPRADLYVTSSAFDDSQSAADLFHQEISPGEIEFSHPHTGMKKTYTLFEEGLRVEISTAQGGDFLIPLTVAPDDRFQPNWPAQYFIRRFPQENLIYWGLRDEKGVAVSIAGAAYEIDTFRDSSAALKRFEDPNFEYPEGHYLPFPMALLTVQASTDFSVTFRPIDFP